MDARGFTTKRPLSLGSRCAIAREQIDLGVAGQVLGLNLKLPWMPKIVRIQERDPGRGRRVNAGVPCRRGSLIVLIDVANPIPVKKKALLRVVNASVIHDYDFRSGAGLSQNTLDGIPQKMAIIIRWYQDCKC